MKRLYCLVLLTFASMFLGGSKSEAMNGRALEDALRQILPDTYDCEASIDMRTLNVAQGLQKYWDDLTVFFVSTAGCGGGNNYGTDIVVFQGNKRLANKATMRPLAFTFIESIKYADIAKTPTLVITAPEYSKNDPRCCPSLKQEVRIWAGNREILWKVVRVWQAN